MVNYIIKTERLGLRNWVQSDLEPYSEICANESVMEFFLSILSKKQTEDFIKRMQNHFAEYGFCYFAVDILKTNEFIGFIGLSHQNYETPFTPFIDIGWRLSSKTWGNGYATEGAKACLDFAFAELNLKEVFAIAPELNKKSQRIMQKIGMMEYLNFEHPKVAVDDPLRKCVAYRIDRENKILINPSTPFRLIF